MAIQIDIMSLFISHLEGTLDFYFKKKFTYIRCFLDLPIFLSNASRLKSLTF